MKAHIIGTPSKKEKAAQLTPEQRRLIQEAISTMTPFIGAIKNNHFDGGVK